MKLTESQTFVLKAAANHPEGVVGPFPDHIKGNARHKVLEGLHVRGLIMARDDQHVLTEAGFTAVGVERQIPAQASNASEVTGNESVLTLPAMPSLTAPNHRGISKQTQIIELLKRPEGATIAQMCELTGWLPHTARGAMAGTLKKKLGLIIVSEKLAGGVRTYRLG